MNGHQYRFEAQAALDPDRREGLLGGGSMQLVTLRLYHGPGVVDALTGEPTTAPDVITDLRPSEARRLAEQLLECAGHADLRRSETD